MKTIQLLITAIVTVLGESLSQAQHGHLNAGAYGRNQNDELYFANGQDFVDSSGYVKTLTYTNSGRFAGYYEGNISLTVLPLSAEHGGPDANAPAAGSFIQFSMACLSGPPGSSFGFWDTGSTSPTDSVGPGETSTNLFQLTESDGSPGSDPYGHIHGRRFTATKAGFYKVGFKVWDTSSNGTNGGPIHRPSEVLPITFQAGINIVQVARTGLVNSVHFGSMAGRTFTLEYTTNLVDTNLWAPVSGPQLGDDFFKSIDDPSAAESYRFYRLRVDPFIP